MSFVEISGSVRGMKDEEEMRFNRGRWKVDQPFWKVPYTPEVGPRRVWKIPYKQGGNFKYFFGMTRHRVPFLYQFCHRITKESLGSEPSDLGRSVDGSPGTGQVMRCHRFNNGWAWAIGACVLTLPYTSYKMAITSSPFSPELLNSPVSYPAEPEPELSEATIAKLQKITQHFSDPNLEIRIDETSTERRKLDQREIMFLVSGIADGFSMTYISSQKKHS